MNRFPLSTESLELLLAFRQCQGLQDLSETLAKDPSVISRRLQRMADEMPVIEKKNNRWALTDLGDQVAELAQKFLVDLDSLRDKKAKTPSLFATKNPALIVINAQNALLAPENGPRNNTSAEEKILDLIDLWRKNGLPVAHVKHLMEDERAPFHRDNVGSKFLPGFEPKGDDFEFEKFTASAFSGTPLLETLNQKDVSEVILVGFTANECIDASARHSSDLGLSTFVVNDATAMFDFRGTDGMLYKADRVHKLTMANLDHFFAKVVSSAEIANELS